MKTQWNFSRTRDVAGRKGRLNRPQMALEALEGRALLSHVHALASHHKAVAADVQMTPTPTPMPHPGPVLNKSGLGFAYKSPRVYPYLQGAPVAALNPAGAKAFVDFQGNLQLRGIVAGTINDKPSDASGSEYYFFIIDRGLSTGASVFPGRPGIKFDAFVTVAITPAGVSGTVYDTVTNTAIPLSSDSITINPDDIQVVVPAAIVSPLNAVSTIKPTANFFGATNPIPSYTDVVGFAGEFHNFLISPKPIPHTGVHH